MTYIEAKMILDPETSSDYIRNKMLELEDVEEACRVSCEAIDRLLKMEDDLK